MLPSRFNPRPVFQPGVTRYLQLTWPLSSCFNPRPVFQPGVTLGPEASQGTVSSFNPRPVFQPGVTPCLEQAVDARSFCTMTRTHVAAGAAIRAVRCIALSTFERS